MAKTRTETDTMGPMEVPADALYGAQTARAAANFRISGWPMPRAFLAALGMIKAAAAEAHRQAGRLEGRLAEAIIAAANEVAAGTLDEHFVVEVFQTGSGTSSNMNANEVIANRAAQLLGGKPGDKKAVHPNDHVNMGQSSNDVIPSAVHLSAAMAIRDELLPALGGLRDCLTDKAKQFDAVVKVGRTHLMDAIPIRLGQEFSGYAAGIEAAIQRLQVALTGLCDLALGGTAVGTGLNAPEGYAAAAIRSLAERTGLPLKEAPNRFHAIGTADAALAASAALRGAAIAMGKVASDVRLLGSGPRCGIGELLLPAVQPGSSIMPAKVNPVICEAVIQTACQVVGYDAAVTAAATGGVGSIWELSASLPVIAYNLLTATRLLAGAATTFVEKCLRGLEANEARCRQLVEQSLMMVTVLAPRIGYDAAAALAKEAHATGKTIRELAMEKKVLPKDELDKLLDPRRQTGK
jgi:fumarate hydratase class II